MQPVHTTLAADPKSCIVLRTIVATRRADPSDSERASQEPRPPAALQRRNQGGARSELTERVTLRAAGYSSSGWTLYVSRGGLRAIVEDHLRADLDYEVLFGEETSGRLARVVWTLDEEDGQIVGMKYLDTESLPPFDVDE